MTSESEMFVYGKPYSPLCTSLIFLHASIFLCLVFCDQMKILFIEYFWGDYIHRYQVPPGIRVHSESV